MQSPALFPSPKYFYAVLALAFLLSSNRLQAQSPSDTWYAQLSKLKTDHLLIHIIDDADNCQLLLDIPGRSLLRLPADTVIYEKKGLYFEFKGLKWTFDGHYKEGGYEGFLQTADTSYQLTFKQRPTWPRSQWLGDNLPYTEKEVRFFNEKDSLTLAGTLTLPEGKGPFPAVVLITGSGPQNRNEEVLGHKPFAVIADAFTRAGMAVLRYDDRGVGASGGQFRPATWRHYANDAAAAVHFLEKQEGIGQIGLLGHSEGGNIAPVVASEEEIAFLLLLAAPGVANIEMQLKQLDYIVRDSSSGYVYERDYPFYEKVYRAMATFEQKAVLRDSLNSWYKDWLAQTPKEELASLGGATAFRESEVQRHTSDWYRAFLQFDVGEYMDEVDIPILALNGSRDEQVDAQQNLGGWQELLAEEQRSAGFSLVLLEGMNHFFQTCTRCTIQEVYFSETTLAPEVLSAMTDWLREQGFLEGASEQYSD